MIEQRSLLCQINDAKLVQIRRRLVWLKVENSHPGTAGLRGKNANTWLVELKIGKTEKVNGIEAVFHVQAMTTNTNEAEDKIMNHKYRSACGTQEE
jgi:hypothetical protein